MSGQPPRLVAAYVITAGVVAIALGAAIGSRNLLGWSALVTWFASIGHAISFRIRMRNRRAPAILLGSARLILAVTLAAVALVAVANVVVIARYVHAGRTWAAPGNLAAGWAVLLVVFAWRAWLVPSARRAAVLQLVGVVFVAPAMMMSTIELSKTGSGSSYRPTLDAAWQISMIVTTVAGPVLDKLFSTLADRAAVDPIPGAHARET